MNILHLDSSITGDHSASRAISAAIVRSLTEASPAARVTYRDLVAEPLGHLTLPDLGSPEARAELDAFHAADVVVIGAAMYNLSLPSQLKAWIDRIMVAGETFRYTETGPVGLAGGKRAIVALARGGLYGESSPARAVEHAERYLRDVLAFIGIAEPEFVIAEGIALGDDARAAALAAAREQAAGLAALAAA
ncbi:MAG: NAD(P)H-dependent oxidoreductase [Sphingomonadales bacterium]|jgi:FMN-dependent NADH-azoreductase|nr:NAD(P)H-dependent oxidoreductase [Sphingomonadales bacterium]